MSEPNQSRLKRTSFIHTARKLERQDPELSQQRIKEIKTYTTVPAWKRSQFPEVKESIPGILPKGTQTDLERKSLTLEYIERNYPEDQWTHAYTDGSAEEAIRNGGGGITILQKDGKRIQHAIPTGKFCTNYKAEAEALQTAATMLIENKEAMHPKIVIFSDALSVLQAVQNPLNKELNTLSSALTLLQQSNDATIIQWIPSHCNIRGNEEADRLAKEGGQLTQDIIETTFEEAKTIVKEKQKKKWKQQHPYHNKHDAYYLLPREDQVTIVRLRTGHCRLRYHMFSKFRIGDSPECPCGTSWMTVDHFLQICPMHDDLRREIWPTDTQIQEKLFGPLEGPQRTAAFVRASRVDV